MTVKHLFSVVCASLLFGSVSYAQTDPTLFSVGKTQVPVSEFSYIYSKTNGNKADFSEKSLQEYLDLYAKFKLKVNRAKEMRLDTIPSLREELDGYRRQLSSSFLIDRTIVEQLTREAYDRSKQDVNASHIYVASSDNADAADTLKAYQKIQGALARLNKGDAWNTVCNELSEDNSNKTTGGVIGWFTALQLPGYYNLESAAYTTPVGKYKNSIVKSPIGYHILKTNETRPAYGEIQAAHILIRTKKGDNNDTDAKTRIDSIHKALQQGAAFDELARRLSQDQLSAVNGGTIGWFGINKYDPTFEAAAFGIQKDNEISQPFKSSLGWHIIKRISRKPIPNFEEARAELQGKVKRDSRFEKAQEVLMNKIKNEAGFKENSAVKANYVKSLKPNFVTYAWKDSTDAEIKNKEIFSIGNRPTMLNELITYLERSGAARGKRGDKGSITAAFDETYNKFVGQKAMEYEETQLERKYPDFRSLMREYEEGTMIFEATKRQVWDKAEDSTGLASFYNTIDKQKYMWGERAKITKYSVSSDDPKIIAAVRKLATKKGMKAVMDKFNKKEVIVSSEEMLYEKGKNPGIDALKWTAGTLSEPVKAGSMTSFMKIDEIMKPMPKSLKEARGYIVAEYQDKLEKEWIEDLKKSYPIKINNDVLKTLVK